MSKNTKQMELLIEQLKKTPIIQIVCEKVGIGRATYYRWYKTKKKFAEKADEALLNGKLLINDMAESQLLAAIKNQNMTAIIYWLKHNHVGYKTQVELSGNLNTIRKLSKEEELMIEKALLHAGIGDNLLPHSKTNGTTK